MESTVTVRRDGSIMRQGALIGWTDRFRQRSGKWRGIKEGGRSKDGFPSRAAAVEWVVKP
jgi:hypothetical protein